MAIAIATLANTPYQMGNVAPPILHNALPAFAYDWNAARVTKVDPFVKTGGRADLRATLLLFLSLYCLFYYSGRTPL